MARQTVDVTVDVHEPTSIIERVSEHEDVESFTVGALDSGDIVIEGVAFERKTPSDFASSMTESDNRLRDQISRMLTEHDNVYVLVEGSITDFDYLTHTNVKGASLRGYTASIEARQGVSVKFCGTEEILVDMAVRLARKHIEDPSKRLKVDSSVTKDEPVVKRMVACVDGVGPDMADRLYEQFDSIPSLLEAAQNGSLEDVDGVGEKTATNIKNALN
jgi:ERCC4-type nuclease